MPLKQILLTPTAQDDLQNAWDYLTEQRSGMGDEFLEEFTDVTHQLLDFPKLYPAVRGDIRRGVIQRFQYIFTYVIEGESIIIARILHTSRNTKYY